MKKNIKKILPIVIMMLFITTAHASVITGTLSTGGVDPATPTGLTTSNPSHGDTGITINWNSVASVGGYNLYRIKDGNPSVFVASTTSTNYSDTSLSDGDYSYQVESYLGILVSEKSAPTAPVTIDTTVVTTTTTTTNGGSGNTSGGGGGGSSGGGGGGILTTPSTASYDFNSDGNIDVFDFNILITNWGTTGTATQPTGDANGDRNVDILDFNLLIINWQS